MDEQTDIMKHVLIILLILALGGGGYLYYLRVQDKNQVDELESKYLQLKTKYNSLLSQQTASPVSTPTATADWKIYTNENYGFTLTFNNNWQGYKVEQDTTNFDDNGIHYRFYLPTTDKDYSTDKVGYVSPFVISVYKLADWEKLQKEEGPKGILIDKNDKYAFGYSTWQDSPEDLVDAITIAEIKKIIDTFEFTEE